MTQPANYHVGISYAYEDEAAVKAVVVALKSVGLKVFFDQDETVQLIGKNLTYTLPEIYANHCEYCLMFVSHSYVSKNWTSYERDWIFGKRIEQQKNDVFTDCVIPVFIDFITLPGLHPGIIGFNLKKQTPEYIANVMYEKIMGTKPQTFTDRLSLKTVFFKILQDIESFLTKQTTFTYQLERQSAYDVVVILNADKRNRFLRLALDEPLYNILKIAQGEILLPRQERVWDGEAYFEENQLYFINYNFNSEFPGFPHPYTAERLSNSILQKMHDLAGENTYV